MSCSAVLVVAAATGTAYAADVPAVAPVAPPTGTFSLFEGIEVHGQIEAGALFNPQNPAPIANSVGGTTGGGYNFGHFYGANANTPQLNQALLTITKPIDPAAKGYAFGFTLQGLYGGDMRYNHFVGIGTYFMGNERAQFNVLQGFGAAHLPWYGGGTDVKVGLFSSPQGYETLDPSTTPFYSHSYTYNYSVTFNHAGILSVTHVNDKFDLWLGVDGGNQVTFGYPNGDPNGVPAGFIGFGLNNLLNNKLTVLALSHIGPENPYPRFGFPAYGGAAVFNPNVPNARDYMRFYNDVVFTYKVNDNLTSVTELNYFKDDFGYGNGFGGGSAATSLSAVQYFSYTINKDYTLNLRGEVYRDNKNFTVATPTDNSGIAKLEQGIAVSSLSSPFLGGLAGQGTTYTSGTIGITFKPDVPKPFTLFAVRPEIRYDRIVAGPGLYGRSTGYTGKDQFTFGGDVIVGF